MSARRAALAALGALALPAAVAVAPTPAAAQRVELAAGAALSSRLLLDGNGTTVRLAPAPYASIDVALRDRATHDDPRRARVGAGVRLAAGAIRASDDGAAWRAGTAWQTDLGVTFARALTRGLRGRATAGATILAGPDGVQPIDGVLVAPFAELGGDVHVRRSVRGELRVQAYRLAPSSGNAGGVVRVLLGATYAR